MNFSDFEQEFLKWSQNSIEVKQDSGLPVCPFARKARLQQKIQFIDARDSLSQLNTFDKSTYEIGIAWLGDINDMEPVEKFCEEAMVANPDLLFFTSSRNSGHFVKNFTDCVFIQLRGDIMEKRKYLKTTKYYDNWPDTYYKLITGEDRD
jgi:hypothetical protein